MNIFGAFTFGSLIKTFLPGFVWLIAFGILAADTAQVLGYQVDRLWDLLKTKDQSALVLAIPVSILLGLLSNVIVFMGVNDRLVRKPMDRKYPELAGLLDELKRRVRQQYWDKLAPQTGLDRAEFFDKIDPEIIVVERIGVEQLAYVREQYWYHLEFQLNLMLSLIAVFGALAIASVVNAESCLAILILAGWIAVGTLFCWALWRAACKNYCRHLAKMASLMTALLAPAEGATTPQLTQQQPG